VGARARARGARASNAAAVAAARASASAHAGPRVDSGTRDGRARDLRYRMTTVMSRRTTSAQSYWVVSAPESTQGPALVRPDVMHSHACCAPRGAGPAVVAAVVSA